MTAICTQFWLFSDNFGYLQTIIAFYTLYFACFLFEFQNTDQGYAHPLQNILLVR